MADRTVGAGTIWGEGYAVEERTARCGVDRAGGARGS
jgi:hypothetical protein